MKKILLAALLAFALIFTGCAKQDAKPEGTKETAKAEEDKKKAEQAAAEANVKAEADAKKEAETAHPSIRAELTVSAAASLTDAMNELKAIYEKKDGGIILTYNFGASGTLQTQIEEGATVDVFMSAAQKQMTALVEKGIVDEAVATKLLVNEVVLITSKKEGAVQIETFEDLTKDEVKTVALGEPGGVPVGQYSEEILTYYGILDDVKAKATYGSDVRQVLSWVASGEADAGIVYKTDAMIEKDNVNIVMSSPEESHKKVVYPVAALKESANREEALAFVEFLKSDEAIAVFEKYGFVKAK